MIFSHNWHVYLVIYCNWKPLLSSVSDAVTQRLYFTQEALATWGYCYSWTRCFHCLCIFLGIWITIPLWLRICWPNEPTRLIDTGDHQSSHSSSPSHWIFRPPSVSLIMDHFNPLRKKIRKKILYKLPTRAWSHSHALNPHENGEEAARNFKNMKW